MVIRNDCFKFGIEAEFLLARLETFQPIWYKDVSFQELNEAFEAIEVSDIPTRGLKLEPPHRKLMPFVVEGYHLPDAEFRPVDLLPKGVEIRTPIAFDVKTCVELLSDLFARLEESLATLGLTAVGLSHHPVETKFVGPQNKRRHDFWRWAMQAMVTYGPDINIALPDELTARLAPDELNAKVNFYGPAMAALSLNSPFFAGGLWRTPKGEFGKSVRTYQRSPVAPAIELHPDQGNRLEFKLFESVASLEDYEAYVLLWLAVLLDEGLAGKASDQDRIYDLGLVARRGLEDDEIRERTKQLLERAPRVLEQWGFASDALSVFGNRCDQARCPADDLIDRSLGGEPLESILKSLSSLTMKSPRPKDVLSALHGADATSRRMAF